MKKNIVLPLAGLLIVAGAVGWGWSSGRLRATPGATGAPATAATATTASAVLVTLAQAQRQTVPVTVQLNGTVMPLNSVDLRPQITNTVKAVHIKEGQFVKAGQLLFTLDDRADLANLAKARAQQQRDEATLADVDRQYRRSVELVGQNFIAKSAAEATLSQFDAQKAAVAADLAAVQVAQVALSYSTLRAPIGGRIGAVNIYPGTLVQTSTTMGTITQLDPIAVSFPVPEAQLHYLLDASRQRLAVDALVPGRAQPVTGTLSFVDNTVDPAIGTVRAKAVFANPDHGLWPGQFVETRVTVRSIADATVIPAAAIMMLSEGNMVYVVDDQRQATQRKVKTLHTFGTQVAVSGISPGDQVVVEGKQNVRPGGKVRVEAKAPGAAPAAGQVLPGPGDAAAATTRVPA